MRSDTLRRKLLIALTVFPPARIMLYGADMTMVALRLLACLALVATALSSVVAHAQAPSAAEREAIAAYQAAMADYNYGSNFPPGDLYRRHWAPRLECFYGVEGVASSRLVERLDRVGEALSHEVAVVASTSQTVTLIDRGAFGSSGVRIRGLYEKLVRMRRHGDRWLISGETRAGSSGCIADEFGPWVRSARFAMCRTQLASSIRDYNDECDTGTLTGNGCSVGWGSVISPEGPYLSDLTQCLQGGGAIWSTTGRYENVRAVPFSDLHYRWDVDDLGGTVGPVDASLQRAIVDVTYTDIDLDGREDAIVLRDHEGRLILEFYAVQRRHLVDLHLRSRVDLIRCAPHRVGIRYRPTRGLRSPARRSAPSMRAHNPRL